MAGHRLYVKGRHLSYQRGRRTTHPRTSLIKIEGVDSTNDANFYLGKRVAYVYRGHKEIRGTKVRVIWGRSPDHMATRVSSVRSSPTLFRLVLSGASVRIFLYPSSI